MKTLQSPGKQTGSERELIDEIIETVANANGVSPTELDTRLYEVVEPDALVNLFQEGDDYSGVEGFVSFPFNGYEVTIYSDSSVEIDQIEDP